MKYKKFDKITAYQVETSFSERGGVSFERMLYRYCSNCGSYSFAFWTYPALKKEGFTGGNPYTSDDKDYNAVNREEALLKKTPCPICGAPASQSGFKSASTSPNDSLYRHENLYNDAHFHSAHHEKGYNSDRAKEKAESFLQEYEYTASRINIDTEQIKGSRAKLEEYLAKLIRLEVNAYSLPKVLADLYCERMEITQKCIYEKGIKSLEYKEAVASAKNDLQKTKKKKFSVRYPVEPKTPELKKPGIFNKTKVLMENKALQDQYNEAMEKYQQEVRACQLEEQRLYENAVSQAEDKIREAEDSLALFLEKSDGNQTPSEVFRAEVDEKIREIENCLTDTLKAKDDMYALGVIFGKYRDLVAVSTFYEYLASGRCTALEGADGAYNLYENEIRTNLIISKLTEIINKLDQIQANQYTLYTELKAANKQLASLNSKMNTAIEALGRIEDNTAQIALNTEVTAYYSKKTAELTDALGYIAALK